MTITEAFLSGATFATFFAAGFFFLKFWKVSRDRFFLMFGLACWLLAAERVALLVTPSDAQAPIRTSLTESFAWIYLIRLAAFSSILFAIIEKNRSSNPK
jgi:hypothetical protein